MMKRASANEGEGAALDAEGGESNDAKKPRYRGTKVCQEAFDEIRLYSEARPLVMESLRNTRSAKLARRLLGKDHEAKQIWGQCDWPFECKTNNHRNAMDVVITVLSYGIQTRCFVTGDNHVCPEWMESEPVKNYIIPEKEDTSLFESRKEAVERIRTLGEEFYEHYEVDKSNYTSSEVQPIKSLAEGG